MAKANKMDATDPQVKEWLPEFERLQKFLPQIKPLDAQIAKSPNDSAVAGLLLERARVLILAGRPLLAIDDGERAFKLQPASMRARIELAEALLDAGQPENAAKLDVGYLRRGEDKLATASPSGGGHVSDAALRELGTLDGRLSVNPKDADALIARARILRDLRQFTLALADANAALAINDKSAAAHFEAAQNLDGLDRQKEALFHARIATELDPQNSNMWFFRGVLERQRADFAGAVASQTRSIEISESLVALSEREQSERRIGKTAEADADLRRIRELAPQK
jgi:tetratricopeptide (TPR) repeat protein